MSFDAQAIASIQTRLASLGWYRLAIDGIAGAGTAEAMTRFKEAHGLRARPFPGPKTMMLLHSPEAEAAPTPAPSMFRVGEPPWLAEARLLLGVREAPGQRNDATIMGWADSLDQWYPGDDVPWCGLFVAHCMATGAPDEPQGFNRLGARAWLEYGEACEIGLGAVCVLWRTHPTRSWHGHVFLVTGQSADGHVRGIGGNQSDQVSERWFAPDRILGFRKPQGGSLIEPPFFVHRGTLSTTEA